MKTLDKTALKILLKYDVLAAGYVARGHILNEYKQQYVKNHLISPDDMEVLKQHGLAFDFISIGHDEAVARCFKAYKQISKKNVVNSFLASLSSNRLDYRSGISAYAIMQTLPDHHYIGDPHPFCKVCSGQEFYENLDLTGLNRQRFEFGSMAVFKTPLEMFFFLEQQNQLAPVSPINDDYVIFNNIIAKISESDSSDKPGEVAKKIKNIPGFKATLDQSKCIMEILGFCGILQTEEHQGCLSKYTNPGLAPSKSRSSNWAYPVDFWTGKDGINRDAFQFWFGDDTQIAIPD